VARRRYNLAMSHVTRRHVLAAAAIAPFGRLLEAIPLSQIRLGVTTDEIDEDLLTAIRFLRRFNLNYAEIRSVWGKYNTEQPLEKIHEARDLLKEHGVKLSMLSTGFFKIPLPAETAEGRRVLDEQWKLLDASFERARILGTDKIRVFAFTHEREPLDRAKLPRIYELVREAARRAKAQKFRLALENVGGSYVSTGAESAALLKAVQEDALGLNWDPNNAGASGEKPFPDGYRLLDPARIIHVHLRDFRHLPGGNVEWAAVGEGEMDNLSQIRALLKDGFKETFNLETHYRSPLGKAHASETSLTGLLKVIEKV
jgi:sugar phosphate isomerase/epimerase